MLASRHLERSHGRYRLPELAPEKHPRFPQLRSLSSQTSVMLSCWSPILAKRPSFFNRRGPTCPVPRIRGPHRIALTPYIAPDRVPQPGNPPARRTPVHIDSAPPPPTSLPRTPNCSTRSPTNSSR